MKVLNIDGESLPLLKWRVVGDPEKGTLQWRFITADGHVRRVEPVQMERCVDWADDDALEVEIKSALSPVAPMVESILAHQGDLVPVQDRARNVLDKFVREYAGRALVKLPTDGASWEWNINADVEESKLERIRIGEIVQRSELDQLVVHIRDTCVRGGRLKHSESEELLDYINKTLFSSERFLMLAKPMRAPIKKAAIKSIVRHDWFVDAIYCCGWMNDPKMQGEVDESAGYRWFLEEQVQFLAHLQSGDATVLLPVRRVDPNPISMNEEDTKIFLMLSGEQGAGKKSVTVDHEWGEYIRRKDVHIYLSIGRTTVQNWIKAKVITPWKKEGNVVLFRRKDLDEAKESRKQSDLL